MNKVELIGRLQMVRKMMAVMRLKQIFSEQLRLATMLNFVQSIWKKVLG